MASVPSLPNVAALFAATPCVPKTYMVELVRMRKQVSDCAADTEGVRLTTTLPLTRCVGLRNVHVFLTSLWHLLPAIVILLCIAEYLLHTSSYLGIPKSQRTANQKMIVTQCATHYITPPTTPPKKTCPHTNVSKMSTWPVAPTGLGLIIRLTQNESRHLYCQDISVA